MHLRDLTEDLKRAIFEALPEKDVDEIIIDQLKNFAADILDAIDTSQKVEQASKLAEDNDYKMYEDALVINVKNRPNIKIDLLDGLVEKFGKDNFNEIYNNIIENFIFVLDGRYKDFVVLGRSGGYWGLDDLTSRLNISEHGYEVLKNKVIELAKNPENDFVKNFDTCVADDDKVNLDGIAYDMCYENTKELADLLIDEPECLEIDPNFLEQMKNLCNDIDEKEKEMNTEEFWSEYEA